MTPPLLQEYKQHYIGFSALVGKDENDQFGGQDPPERRNPKIEFVNIMKQKATYSTSHTETNVCSAMFNAMFVRLCVWGFCNFSLEFQL